MTVIEKHVQEIRETEAKMYADKISGMVEEDTFHNVTHILNQEIKNLTDENSQLIIILDKVDDLKKGIDSFVQKVERFSECNITADDRFIVEQLIDHIEIHENEKSEIVVKIFFADVGVIE